MFENVSLETKVVVGLVVVLLMFYSTSGMKGIASALSKMLNVISTMFGAGQKITASLAKAL